MDRRAMIDALRHRTNYTSREIRKFLSAFSQLLQEELVAGGEVYLGGIGRFTTYQAGPWKGRDPRTGEPMDIPIKWRVKLVPCKELRDRVEFSPKLYKEEDLLERYGIKKETGNGEIRSTDRSEAGREGKARQRFPWSR